MKLNLTDFDDLLSHSRRNIIEITSKQQKICRNEESFKSTKDKGGDKGGDPRGVDLCEVKEGEVGDYSKRCTRGTIL